MEAITRGECDFLIGVTTASIVYDDYWWLNQRTSTEDQDAMKLIEVAVKHANGIRTQGLTVDIYRVYTPEWNWWTKQATTTRLASYNSGGKAFQQIRNVGFTTTPFFETFFFIRHEWELFFLKVVRVEQSRPGLVLKTNIGYKVPPTIRQNRTGSTSSAKKNTKRPAKRRSKGIM